MMIKKLKNFPEHIFSKKSRENVREVFSKARSNPEKIALIVLFDVMFIASLVSYNWLVKLFVSTLFIPQSSIMVSIVVSIMSLMYYAIMILLYSFFKYSVLSFISSLFKKSSLEFSSLGKFYAVNCIVAAAYIALFLVLGQVIANMQEFYAPFVLMIIGIPYLLTAYLILNISQTAFYEKNYVWKSIKESLSITFSGFGSYRGMLGFNMIAFGIVAVVFYGVGSVINLIASRNYALYLSVYNVYKAIFFIVMYAFIYIIVAVNRIWLYKIVDKGH